MFLLVLLTRYISVRHVQGANGNVDGDYGDCDGDVVGDGHGGAGDGRRDWGAK